MIYFKVMAAFPAMSEFMITHFRAPNFFHIFQIGASAVSSSQPEALHDISVNVGLEIDDGGAFKQKDSYESACAVGEDVNLLAIARVAISSSKRWVKSYTFPSTIWMTVISSVTTTPGLFNSVSIYF